MHTVLSINIDDVWPVDTIIVEVAHIYTFPTDYLRSVSFVRASSSQESIESKHECFILQTIALSLSPSSTITTKPSTARLKSPGARLTGQLATMQLHGRFHS